MYTFLGDTNQFQIPNYRARKKKIYSLD